MISRYVRHPITLLAVVASLYLVFAFPGHLDSDTVNQLSQARSGIYEDWHPPIMAVVWSFFLKLPGGEYSLFLLHQAVYWSAFAIIVATAYRSGHTTQSWLIVGLSCFPYFLQQNYAVVKDTGMAVTFLFAFALAYRCDTLGGWRSKIVVASFVVALSYGTLVRSNAVFALGPLLLLVLPRRWRPRIGLAMASTVSIIIALAAIPVSNFFNYDIVGAKSRDRTQSIQLFDTIGIAILSGDESVLGDWRISLPEARSCYTPYWWDTFAPYGICARYREGMHIPDSGFATEAARDQRTRQWLNAILKHPAAYIEHRLNHFNASIFFIVPSFHYRYSRNEFKDPLDSQWRSQTKRSYFTRSFLIWPVTWLSIGLAFLFLSSRVDELRDKLFIFRMLALSGILYGLAYFIVGIAVDLHRYYYWTTVAVGVSVLLSGEVLMKRWRDYSLVLWYPLTGLLLLLVLGYYARFADITLPGFPS